MEEKVFFLLRNIIKNMRKVLDKEIAGFGIGHSEMRLLSMLYESGNCKQDDLISKIEVDRSNVGRSLKKLEKQEYIAREKDSNDFRSYNVIITKKGLEIKPELMRIKENIEKTLSSNLNKKEVQNLLKLLTTLDLNMTETNYENVKKAN